MASRRDDQRSALAGATGRAAFFPARTAARVWRDEIEAALEEALATPEIARVIDRALAGPLPEQVVRSAVRHRVLERVVAELAASGELERLLQSALVSEEAKQAVREVAGSAEVRAAIARQTSGLAEEVVGGIRASAARLDDRVERAVRRRERLIPPPYAGLATRALALAIDTLVTIGLYMSVVGVFAVMSSLVGGVRPDWLVGVLLGLGWSAVVGCYFVLFWSAAGQTPGMRLVRLRIGTESGDPPSAGRSILRLVGLGLAIVPMFAGFVPVLFDERRRGLSDYLARTTVIYDPARPRAPA